MVEFVKYGGTRCQEVAAGVPPGDRQAAGRGVSISVMKAPLGGMEAPSGSWVPEGVRGRAPDLHPRCGGK